MKGTNIYEVYRTQTVILSLLFILSHRILTAVPRGKDFFLYFSHQETDSENQNLFCSLNHLSQLFTYSVFFPLLWDWFSSWRVDTTRIYWITLPLFFQFVLWQVLELIGRLFGLVLCLIYIWNAQISESPQRRHRKKTSFINSKSVLSRAFPSAQNAKLNCLKIFRDKVGKWLRQKRTTKEFGPLTFEALSVKHRACFENERWAQRTWSLLYTTSSLFWEMDVKKKTKQNRCSNFYICNKAQKQVQ